jgi:hypothetical protein
MLSQKEFQRYLDRFAQAEKIVKEIQRADEEVVIPAINQLRYAGRHIFEYLADPNHEDSQKHLNEIDAHISRATFDALEAGVLFLLGEVKEFKAFARLVTVTDVIPNYLDYMKDVRKIKVYLAGIENRDFRDDTDKLYQMYKELEEICHSLEDAKEEIAKKFNIWRIGIMIALGSILVAIIIAIISG